MKHKLLVPFIFQVLISSRVQRLSAFNVGLKEITFRKKVIFKMAGFISYIKTSKHITISSPESPLACSEQVTSQTRKRAK